MPPSSGAQIDPRGIALEEIAEFAQVHQLFHALAVARMQERDMNHSVSRGG